MADVEFDVSMMQAVFGEVSAYQRVQASRKRPEEVVRV